MARIPSSLPPPYSTVLSARSSPTSLRSQLHHLTTSHVRLLVTPKSHPFTIHASLLTTHSAFFAAALSGPFLEARTQEIHLPSETLETFELFLLWLYTPTLSPSLFFKDGKPAYYILLHLYGLADRLDVEALRNQIVDMVAELAEATNSVLTPSDTWILYEDIPATKGLRRLAVDLFAFKKTERLVGEHRDEWHPGFMRDLVVQLKKPSEAAMARHALLLGSLLPLEVTPPAQLKACEVCRVVLVPGAAAAGSEGKCFRCTACRRAFCRACVARGTGKAEWERGEEVCRPWLGARCRLYHEHGRTERCGDVMMGR